VVDVLGGPAAVLALVFITHEDGAARQRRARTMRDVHVVAKLDDAGGCELEGLGAEEMAVRVDHVGLVFERKNQCSPYRNYAQRLIRRVQHQRSSQRETSVSLPPPKPGL
jgi:hypothetical protein